MNKYTRRSALKKLSLSAGALLMGKFPDGLDARTPLLWDEPDPNYVKPTKAVTVICCGAGARGNVYGNFAAEYPDEMKVVGVAEPIAVRNDRYAQKHQIPAENRFTTWEHVFNRPKFADAVLITMPDHLHYEPCMKALEMGYDVLLEKPMAQSEQECRDILKRVHQKQAIVGLCHVLRYAPYFVKLREIIHSGAIGELISIQHLEPIEHIHMSHSYVRGNWHNSKETTPIILAKSCHDLDIIRWIVGKPCSKITAMGGLKWFKSENAPEGTTARCADGCKAESSCPYSALKIYKPNGGWNYVLDMPEDASKHAAHIAEKLRTTNYGRCVYHMENDQPDHYVCNMEFEGGVTANFSMEAFTGYAGRRTRVFGSMGDIVGDMDTFTVNDFKTNKATVYDHSMIEDVANYKNSGHGGGDWRLVRDWIQAVSRRDASLLTSTIDASIESHIMGFLADKGRLKGKVMSVKV